MRVRDTFKEKVCRSILALMTAILFIGFAMTFIPVYKRNMALRQEDARLLRQIAAKTAQIERLRECRRRFKVDSDFVEAIARQAKRVYPGELVFIFKE